MKLVTPEQWYVVWWAAAGLAFLVGQYFVVKWAIVAAARVVFGVRPEWWR